MKRLIFPFLAIVTLFYISGCSEKFDIAAPYKSYTVVYAFLDKADTAHYVRIEKAFLDQDKNALTMAKSSDSNFYAHLNVMIKRLNFSDGLFDTIHLNRVNLDVEGYPKQPGVFFESPNYAYKFTNALDAQYNYRIIITNLTTGNVDSADAPVFDNAASKFLIDAIDFSPTPTMDFNSTFPNKYYELSGQYLAPPNFSFHGQTSPAAVAQGIIRFNWVDSDIITHQYSNHSCEYNTGVQSITNGSLDFQIKNTSLYSTLASGMLPAPANQIRLLDRCDVSVYLGTDDFRKYQESVVIQGTGLTGAEIQPISTNVKGVNVLGLFTSRGMRTGKVTITKTTIDSIMVNPLLKDANIKGTIYH